MQPIRLVLPEAVSVVATAGDDGGKKVEGADWNSFPLLKMEACPHAAAYGAERPGKSGESGEEKAWWNEACASLRLKQSGPKTGLKKEAGTRNHHHHRRYRHRRSCRRPCVRQTRQRTSERHAQAQVE